ncbi:hypothetical protein [Clostridium sp. L74]|uniref:hypothetical protein n=1 Tax=Clostridium sp. L74 TaxID=1560217 RepID=UPI0006AB9762|nr:hypothetical protein [Clostridium sp. L74]KOR24191.1 hypothetical protein ND00_28970 [Clostridium sp. L74]
MHQNSYKIGASHKKLRLIGGDHFISLPLKVKKADIKTKLNVDEILEAGTLITAEGKPVITTSTTTDVYGIVYQDVNFRNSMAKDGITDNACEIVPVFVHGAVYESAVKLDTINAAVEKKALNMIIFGK